MLETSQSLLDRLKQPADAAAWRRLVDLYSPFIRGVLQRQGVPNVDADDLTQEVLAAVVRALPQFQHVGHAGAFRGWLRTMTVNRLKGYWRSRQTKPRAAGGSDFARQLEQLEDPHSHLSKMWEQEHDHHVAHRLLELIEHDFEPTTWRAFRRVVMDDADPAAVAAELGLTINAVWSAKSRVLRRLRREATGLVE